MNLQATCLGRAQEGSRHNPHTGDPLLPYQTAAILFLKLKYCLVFYVAVRTCLCVSVEETQYFMPVFQQASFERLTSHCWNRRAIAYCFESKSFRRESRGHGGIKWYSDAKLFTNMRALALFCHQFHLLCTNIPCHMMQQSCDCIAFLHIQTQVSPSSVVCISTKSQKVKKKKQVQLQWWSQTSSLIK